MYLCVRVCKLPETIYMAYPTCLPCIDPIINCMVHLCVIHFIIPSYCNDCHIVICTMHCVHYALNCRYCTTLQTLHHPAHISSYCIISSYSIMLHPFASYYRHYNILNQIALYCIMLHHTADLASYLIILHHTIDIALYCILLHHPAVIASYLIILHHTIDTALY